VAAFTSAFTEEDIRRWQKVYSSIRVDSEIWKMCEWVMANPAKSKKNWKRFIINWLAKAQREAEAIETREVVRHELSRATARNY
jgi:hypothetical protein